MSEKRVEKSRSPKTLRPPSQYHNICATFYWKEEKDCEIINEFINNFCRYGVYGKEICPTTSRPHLQMYMELTRKMTIKGIHKKLNDLTQPISNIDKRYGTPKEAAGYCKKGSGPDRKGLTPGNELYFDKPHETFDGFEYGKISHPGERNDLKEINDQLLNGQITISEILETMPDNYHKYERTFRATERLRFEKTFRTWMTECDWHYGPTATGKSEVAFKDYKTETHYRWKLNDKDWQDGYKGQEIVIINEFRGQIKYSELLDMIDRYPYDIPRRNHGPTPFLAKKIIITSSMRPEEVYNNLHENDKLEQLMRRIKLIEHKKLKNYSS